MACPHHPDKSYIMKDGKLECPDCGYISPYQLAKDDIELLKENQQLKERNLKLERCLSEVIEIIDGERNSEDKIIRHARKLLDAS